MNVTPSFGLLHTIAQSVHAADRFVTNMVRSSQVLDDTATESATNQPVKPMINRASDTPPPRGGMVDIKV